MKQNCSQRAGWGRPHVHMCTCHTFTHMYSHTDTRVCTHTAHLTTPSVPWAGVQIHTPPPLACHPLVLGDVWERMAGSLVRKGSHQGMPRRIKVRKQEVSRRGRKSLSSCQRPTWHHVYPRSTPEERGPSEASPHQAYSGWNPTIDISRRPILLDLRDSRKGSGQ